MEKLANVTTAALADTQQALSSLTAEVVTIHTVARQNRMALDFILAEKGGTCAIIGRYCTYIPDESSNNTDLAAHISQEVGKIQKIGEEMHHYTDGAAWSVFSFLYGSILKNILHYGIILLMIIALLYTIKFTRSSCKSWRF